MNVQNYSSYFPNITALKEAIKEYSLKGKSGVGNPLIYKVVVTLPLKHNKKITPEHSELVILDMPGQEDLQQLDRIQGYMQYHKDTLIPVILVDLCSGTFDVPSYKYI